MKLINKVAQLREKDLNKRDEILDMCRKAMYKLLEDKITKYPFKNSWDFGPISKMIRNLGFINSYLKSEDILKRYEVGSDEIKMIFIEVAVENGFDYVIDGENERLHLTMPLTVDENDEPSKPLSTS